MGAQQPGTEARILIAGATGLVGAMVLARALADPRVSRVVAPTRTPVEPHPKLDNPLIDFDRLPTDAGWWAVDGAVSALGTTRAKAGSAQAFRAVDHDYVLAVARCVRNSGASRFALTSSMGADSGSRFLYTRTKGEAETALRSMQFPSLTIVRPGLLGGSRAEFRVAERLASTVLRLAHPILPRHLRISPAGRVAEVLLEAAIAGQPGTAMVEATHLAD